MEAKALADLITELKDVVSKNVRNENDTRLIVAKWNQRRDLTSNSKSVVINLLYEDVKSVIKDSGVQYQIYSIFSFTKQIPDEQFIGKSASTPTNSSKEETVEKLVDLVFAAHPFVNIEDQTANLPGTKSALEADRKQRFRVFDEALKANKKLTPDQKAFVKTNYDRLNIIVNEKLDAAMNLNFPTEQWVREGMEKIFAEKFSDKEINDLNAFFGSDKGRQTLNYIRQTEMAQLITGNGGKPKFTAADLAEHDKFASTALGKKFIAAYLTETEAYQQKKESEVRTKVPNADGFATLETANLNKIFNQFVKDNYKK